MVSDMLCQVAVIRPGAQGFVLTGCSILDVRAFCWVAIDKAKITAASDISAKLMSFSSPWYKITSSQAVLPSRPSSVLTG